jgi:hypothetical protein
MSRLVNEIKEIKQRILFLRVPAQKAQWQRILTSRINRLNTEIEVIQEKLEMSFTMTPEQKADWQYLLDVRMDI